MPVSALGSRGLTFAVDLALDAVLYFGAGLGLFMIYASIGSCDSALGIAFCVRPVPCNCEVRPRGKPPPVIP
jgi:hypothetical protein